MNIKVQGEQVLSGEINPSGSKNSAVALIPATILFRDPIMLSNIPDITDIARLVTVLKNLGSKIIWNKEKKELYINNSSINFNSISKSEVGNMRGISLL
ncbi:MAG: UDP-N-acetylglucosamine 1-carboxyvinyltransferase, partial [Patescibacteria group bacterium]